MLPLFFRKLMYLFHFFTGSRIKPRAREALARGRLGSREPGSRPSVRPASRALLGRTGRSAARGTRRPASGAGARRPPAHTEGPDQALEITYKVAWRLHIDEPAAATARGGGPPAQERGLPPVGPASPPPAAEPGGRRKAAQQSLSRTRTPSTEAVRAQRRKKGAKGEAEPGSRRTRPARPPQALRPAGRRRGCARRSAQVSPRAPGGPRRRTRSAPGASRPRLRGRALREAPPRAPPPGRASPSRAAPTLSRVIAPPLFRPASPQRSTSGLRSPARARPPARRRGSRTSRTRCAALAAAERRPPEAEPLVPRPESVGAAESTAPERRRR